MDFDNFKSHFPTEISKSLVRYVSEVALKESRYLFTKSVLGVQFAHCTHCNKRHQTKEKLKHKQEAVCPNCKSKCKVQAAGLSRKYMEDRAVVVWYERSLADPGAITARILSVSRDYSIEDFTQAKTKYNCSHMYLFEPGKSYYFQLNYGGWKQRASVYSAFDNHFNGLCYGKKHMSISNIKSAVKGTLFQYSTWEQYTKYKNLQYVSDMVEFFDLASRYPCIEYLTKAGLRAFVDAKLYKDPTYGAIYWKGKTLQKVLRLTKQELNDLRNSGLPFKPVHLRFFQKSKKEGKPFSISESFVLAEIDEPYYRNNYLKDILKLTSEENALKYIVKQVRNRHYDSATSTIIDWRDYQKECKQLGMDLNEESNLFPNNLRKAHEKTTARIKLKADKKLNEKIALRLDELNKFVFKQGKFILRPAESSVELFLEGKALKHCVGSYTEQYAEGKKNIFLIRRSDDPDTSFFTIEVVGNKVIQCRGYKNCDMTPEVRIFVNAFIQKKLLTKKRTRIDITGIQPNNNEVAV